MNDLDNVKKELIERAAAVLKIEPSKLDPNTSLVSYGMDSLSFFNLSYELEEKYGLNFIDDELAMDISINDLIDKISKKQAAS